MDTAGNLLNYEQFCVRRCFNAPTHLSGNVLMKDYFLGKIKNNILYKFDKSTVTKFRCMYLKFPVPP